MVYLIARSFILSQVHLWVMLGIVSCHPLPVSFLVVLIYYVDHASVYSEHQQMYKYC